ncbi:GyrI-like domain-containing protein [Chryseolinea lacunae]|uniref:AraC effector-binding domain-containing protein n=1 Tax=Chryseolinea lacunae TaxID=2801331 RepID=A0ABS1KK34_9BACT|nr:GyrI-like domain-containing protein [Chryseolinea lacunae]MBL0739602.1 hypothetical protein [Chryseolinea lacunae]
MQLKEISPTTFLFFKTETHLNELGRFIPVGQELFQEAVKQKLFITGPIHWHYFGFTGEPDKPFTLEVALPISEAPADYDGVFHIKRTEPFKSAVTVHEGNWQTLPDAYGRLIQFMHDNKLKPNGATREIYINSDLHAPAANVTMIQMGVE